METCSALIRCDPAASLPVGCQWWKKTQASRVAAAWELGYLCL
jgi:hypothetical protein